MTKTELHQKYLKSSGKESLYNTQGEIDLDYVKFLENQILGKNKPITIGTELLIKKNIYGHEFEIHQVVHVIEKVKYIATPWLCSDGVNEWYLSEEEVSRLN